MTKKKTAQGILDSERSPLADLFTSLKNLSSIKFSSIFYIYLTLVYRRSMKALCWL